MNWKFEYIEGWEECFEGNVAKWWDTLPLDHVFNDRRIVKVWCETFGAVHNINLLWIIGTDTTTGNKSLWPWVIWHKNWKNAYVKSLFPAGNGAFDYHTPMFERPVDSNGMQVYFSDLIADLKRRGGFDEIVFEGIPDWALPSDSSQWTRDEICPYLDLSEIHNEEDLLKFFKTNLRKNLQRRWRRLSEIGDLELVEFKTWNDASKEFDAYMAAHAARWPNAYVIPCFHKALLADELLQGPVSFTALKVGNKTAGWHLGFEDKDRFYYYRSAVNLEFNLYSPGNLQLWQLVKRAIEKGQKVYDHLRGEELYKDGWSNGAQYVNKLRLQASGASSSIRCSLLKIRNKIL